MIVQNAPADPLSDILGFLNTGAACSIRFTAGGAWSLRFNPRYVKFNVLQCGACWIIADGKVRQLIAGDCFMVTAQPFVLASDPELAPHDASEVFEKDGTEGAIGSEIDVDILGGSIDFASTQGELLLPLLPGLLVVGSREASASSMAWLTKRLDAEWRSGAPGARAACDGIVRLLFLEALRCHLRENRHPPSWMAGLKDPAITRVLHAIHAEPGRHWRLEELALLAGQSRSAFSERFTRLVGQAPVSYANNWRMRWAAKLLTEGSKSIASVANDAGYLNDSSFNVAFKREIGLSPARYRRYSSERSQQTKVD